MLQSPQNCKHCEQRDHHGAGSTDPVRIQKANVHPFIAEKRYPWVLACSPVIRAAIRLRREQASGDSQSSRPEELPDGPRRGVPSVGLLLD
jgi:hypothetical protein